MSASVAQIYIETNRGEYKDVFPTDIANDVYEAAKQVSVLMPLVDKLVLNWRAAAYLAQMPGVFVATSDSPHKLEIIRSDTQLLTFTELLLSKLQQKVPELSTDPALRSRLRVACLDSAAEYRATIENLSSSQLEEESWRTMLESKPFVMYIWYSQRSCYMFAVTAFEHFLVGVTQIHFPTQRVRSTDRDFGDRLRRVVGRKAESKCWSGEEAIIRREVRNSLVHASGDVTDKLSRLKHGLRTIDESLQICVSDNKHLFRKLVENVSLVCHEFSES